MNDREGYVVASARYCGGEWRVCFRCYDFETDREYGSSDIYDPHILLFADFATAKSYCEIEGDFVYFRNSWQFKKGE